MRVNIFSCHQADNETNYLAKLVRIHANLQEEQQKGILHKSLNFNNANKCSWC